MSTETASQYMISTLQGFQLGVDKAEEITDKYNEVAKQLLAKRTVMCGV